MHLMPGGPVYESTDLVHWTLASYLFDRLSDSPLYDLHGGTSYGRGQWATSLKYHDGTFYALFCTNDPQGGADSYVFATNDPRKGWTLHSRLPHFHDPSLFFATSPGGNYATVPTISQDPTARLSSWKTTMQDSPTWDKVRLLTRLLLRGRRRGPGTASSSKTVMPLGAFLF